MGFASIPGRTTGRISRICRCRSTRSIMEGHAQHRSPTMPVKGLLFRENQLGPQGEYHTPKQRQFVITISGAVEITCAGGSRVFGPGDVLFAEDLKGEGHSNRELHGPRMSLIIQVTEDFDI